MIKYFIALFLLLPSIANAQQLPPKPAIECVNEIPFGAPLSKPDTITNCRTGYLINISLDAKIPHWTAHTIVPSDSVACLPREDSFAPDLSLPKGKRAELEDYRKSGYDQGHMVSNADLSFSEIAQKESFLLSNMSPQLPGLNRGPWKHLETATRAWAWTSKSNISVIAGNIWDANSKTIGPNKVVVPDQLFKIVIVHNTKQSYAFLFPNREALGGNFQSFQTTTAELEKVTGFTFNVPDNKMLKNPILPVDSKRLTDDKREACK